MTNIPMTNWKKPAPPEKPTHKVCQKCPEEGVKPLTEFSKVPSAPDGRSRVCKACQRKSSKERAARLKEEKERYGLF